MDIIDRISYANGEKEVDLLIKNAQLVNVFSGRIVNTDIAVAERYIVGFGDYKAKREIDAKGLFLAPGLMDGHVHIESSMATIPQYARAVMPLGTTTVIIDPHEIANVFGLEGIRYMIMSASKTPLGVYIMLPSCVPATDMETSGATLNVYDLATFLNEDWVLGLGEVMNYPGVIYKDKGVIDKIKAIHNKRIDGHAPGVRGKDLNAYISAGIKSDHECTTLEEAYEKLEKGMYIMMREGTSAKNLKSLLPLINSENERRCMFVTDDRHPKDLIEQGHINYMVKTAIRSGIEPIKAVRMATLNIAEYFHLYDLGAVAPGYKADFILFDNFGDFNIKMTFKNGQLVAENGKFIAEHKDADIDIRSSINVKWLELKDFRLKAEGKKANIIEVVPHELITKKIIDEILIDEHGYAISDIKKDILKIVVVERHKATGNIGKGFIKGFGLKAGAIASSVAHDSHNIVVVGVNDEDILTAAVEIVKMGGGLVIVKNKQILDKLPLPIAGLMTNEPIAEVSKHLDKMNLIIKKELGGKLDDPFMTLSFMALPVIPSLKLTDKGLVDVEKFKIIPLFIK